MNRTLPILAAAVSLTAAAASAQGVWLQLSPSTVPPARAMGGMAAMLQQNQTIFFGGEVVTGGASLNDTWSWDGANWTQVNTTSSPVPLEGFAMSYDLIRDRIVLFSGWNGGAYPSDTWEFDGTNWAQMTPATSPPGRDWLGMAYDFASNQCIVFGGHDWQVPGGRLNDTWAWDGTNWTALTPATLPTPRWGHGMAYDPVNGRVIMFGGNDSGSVGNEMWEWTGTDWSQVTPATTPPPRQWHQMTTDPSRNVVVMTGGEWMGTQLNDVWEWDGTDWTQITTPGAPAGTSLHFEAYDPVLGQLLRFGGSTAPGRAASTDETWAYSPTATGLATAVPYGSGCGAVTNYASYYEEYAATGFDMGGTPGNEFAFNHTYAGTGYVVLPSGSAWFTPVNPDLGLNDDQVSAAQSLGFTLPLPGGGQTNDVWICSNGYIWLASNALADYTPSVNEFLTDSPRLAPLWTDLRPGSGGGSGTIHFDTDPTNGVAYVTFLAVDQYPGGGASTTMQVALYSSGNIEYRYGTETFSSLGTGNQLVGMTPGNGALDPGGTDISTSLPIFTQPDLVVADMSLSSGRPVEGTTINATIDNLPTSSIFGVLALSSGQVVPGIQPVPGLGSCVQLVASIDPVYFTPTGSTHVMPLAIPSGAFTGQTIYAQAIVLAPGFNPASVASSNGIAWTIDVN